MRMRSNSAMDRCSRSAAGRSRPKSVHLLHSHCNESSRPDAAHTACVCTRTHRRVIVKYLEFVKGCITRRDKPMICKDFRDCGALTKGGAIAKVMAYTLIAIVAGCRHRSDLSMARSGSNENRGVVDAEQLARRPESRTPASRPTLHAAVEPLGESVKGRPLELRRFGDPAARSRVLILGGIHGDETTTVDLTRSLIELLTADPSKAAGRHV